MRSPLRFFVFQREINVFMSCVKLEAERAEIKGTQNMVFRHSGMSWLKAPLTAG